MSVTPTEGFIFPVTRDAKHNAEDFQIHCGVGFGQNRFPHEGGGSIMGHKRGRQVTVVSR